MALICKNVVTVYANFDKQITPLLATKQAFLCGKIRIKKQEDIQEFVNAGNSTPQSLFAAGKMAVRWQPVRCGGWWLASSCLHSSPWQRGGGWLLGGETPRPLQDMANPLSRFTGGHHVAKVSLRKPQRCVWVIQTLWFSCLFLGFSVVESRLSSHLQASPLGQACSHEGLVHHACPVGERSIE